MRPATAAAAALILTPALTWGQQTTTTSSGSVGCAAIAQAAADGISARIAADDTAIQPPKSVTQLTCLDNIFRGIGIDVITNLLDPSKLIDAIEGQICQAVQQTWDSLLGSIQCGLTLNGINLGFGGLGGGLSCPRLSFGGDGPPITGLGINVMNGGSGLYIEGNGIAPSGYSVPNLPPGSF